MGLDTIDQVIEAAGFPDFRWTDGSEVVVGKALKALPALRSLSKP
jgi:hypothetical protein